MPHMRMNIKNFGIKIVLVSAARKRATAVALDWPSTCEIK